MDKHLKKYDFYFTVRFSGDCTYDNDDLLKYVHRIKTDLLKFREVVVSDEDSMDVVGRFAINRIVFETLMEQ